MIKIALRFHPFTHANYTRTLIPETTLAVEITPRRVVIFDPSTKNVTAEFDFSKFCPLTQFTVINDLEKRKIFVSGKSQGGFMRYSIEAGRITFLKGDSVTYSFPCKQIKAFPSRLSLGCHKKQDIERIVSRGDLTEIIPILYFLSGVLPSIQDDVHGQSLIEEVAQEIADTSPEKVGALLQDIIKVGFTDLLFPILNGHIHTGHLLQVVAPTTNPLLIYQKLYPLIKSLFFQEVGDEWHFLKVLPKAFQAGRLIDLKTKDGHLVSMEWRKKQLKRVVVRAHSHSTCYPFKSSNAIKRFRMTVQGKIQGIFPKTAPISFEKDNIYCFDRFER